MKKQIFTIILLLMGGVATFGQSFKLDATGANDMRLRTSGADRLTILPTSGNVGIGTITPNAKLHVLKGSAGAVIAGSSTVATFESNTNAFLSLLNPASGIGSIVFGNPTSNSLGWLSYDHSDNKLRFGTSGIDRMMISTTGNVGIGIAPNANSRLIVSKGISGVTPGSSVSTVIEDNASHYVGIYSPNATETGILFGTPSGSGNNTGLLSTATSDIKLTTNASTKMIVLNNGNVGIGTNTPNNKLDVKGIMRAEEVVVETGWADYVFEPEFKLKTLEEVEQFIKINKHLPDILPASTIQQKGLPVAEMTTKMMQKIEELTLYMIEQDKKIQSLQNQLSNLRKN